MNKRVVKVIYVWCLKVVYGYSTKIYKETNLRLSTYLIGKIKNN